MRRHAWLALFAVFLGATAAAQPQLSGPLAGTYGPGTYLIIGNISVPSANQVVLLPGTAFRFMPNCEFTISGSFSAIGTDTDSINFIPHIAGTTWNGLFFSYSPSSRLAYCLIAGSDNGGIRVRSEWQIYTYIRRCTITGNRTPWSGGGICGYLGMSAMDISDCLISENAAGTGGGIYVGSLAQINNCLIYGNSANFGGGIEGGDHFSGCVIRDNIASVFGGGLFANKVSPEFSFCTFGGNISGQAGGGIFVCWSTCSLNHCTVSGNSAGTTGGGLHLDELTTIQMTNSVVEGNEGQYGMYFADSPMGTITYSDFSGNEVGNFNNPLAGVGTMVGINVNGDSCDVFYNIFEDPLFADPGNGNFQLTWENFPIPDSTMSPCIDAGNPVTPFDPDGTIADMGAFYFDQGIMPAIEVSLEPIHPPIIIPSTGGRFAYNLEIANADSIACTFDFWIMVGLPGDSLYGPVFSLTEAMLPAESSISRIRTQAVPLPAPEGQYDYIGYAGLYSSTIYDSSYFTFMKVCEGIDGPRIEDWSNTGESFNSADDLTIPHYSSFLASVRPNPFNPKTAISFQLLAGGYVSLKVYDTAGRLVGTLTDGWREAGGHEVIFDGRDLASGIYIYRLEAGEYTASGKMVLMK